MDVYGLALKDYFEGKYEQPLWLRNSYGEPEEMPVEVFFRTKEEMPEIELLALDECRGKILDIGAGVGSHVLVLQSMGHDVTALEISEEACSIMKKRGIRKIANENFFTFKEGKFDTLLLLMNGIGLCMNLEGLEKFLLHAKTLLNNGGCLLFDSSDIAYLYEDGVRPLSKYYGEIAYQYYYKEISGEWFSWLYVDPDTLREVSKRMEWNCEILIKEDTDQYLAKLTYKS